MLTVCDLKDNLLRFSRDNLVDDMPLPPQKFREAVFQILFMNDFVFLEKETISFMMAELKTTRNEISEALKRVEAILDKIKQIDQMISTYSTEYSFERISRVEKAILRLGLFELFFDCEKIPPKVAFAEGIRLCRKFGTNESAQFINAILDGVYTQAHAATKEPAIV